jgi:hypothetical protein
MAGLHAVFVHCRRGANHPIAIHRELDEATTLPKDSSTTSPLLAICVRPSSHETLLCRETFFGARCCCRTSSTGPATSSKPQQAAVGCSRPAASRCPPGQAIAALPRFHQSQPLAPSRRCSRHRRASSYILIPYLSSILAYAMRFDLSISIVYS